MTGSRSETAWRILQSAIINGEFPPGAQLRFQELQEFCGMSVSPVREALTRLVAAGLVEVEHNRGYRVTKLVVSELDDLVRTRSRVEGWALEESIRLGDEHWEAALISSLHLLEHLPRRRENGANLHDEHWEARHSEFHDTLVSACGSPILLEFCRTLYSRADRYRRFSLSMETGSRDVAAEHRAILDAALARDADKAKGLLAAHYEATASFIRDHLSEE